MRWMHGVRGVRGRAGMVVGRCLGHEGAFAAQDFVAFQAAPARVGLTAAGWLSR